MSYNNRESLSCLNPRNSSSSSKKQDDPPCGSPLLELPPELRHLIWATVVREPDTISISHFAPRLGHLDTIVDLCDKPPPASQPHSTTAFEFTHLSQQINNEATALYYKSNTFRYVVADRGYVRLRAWIDVIRRVVGPRAAMNDNDNPIGPFLEVEHVGWVHSYEHVPVRHIHRGKAFIDLCHALARAGFREGTVKMTFAGSGSCFGGGAGSYGGGGEGEAGEGEG